MGNCVGTLARCSARLAEQKESKIEEGHLLSDHVHMMIAIPPKYSVSQVIGYIKGKSAIHLARVYGERKRISSGSTFGHAGTLCPPSGETKQQSAPTFETKSRRIGGWTN